MSNVHDLRQQLVSIDKMIDQVKKLTYERGRDLGEAMHQVLEQTANRLEKLLEDAAVGEEPQAHELLYHFRPDQVAECWEGVDDKLYRQLWALMSNLPPMPGSDEIADMGPDDIRIYDRSVAAYWGKLGVTDRKLLNGLAEKMCRG